MKKIISLFLAACCAAPALAENLPATNPINAIINAHLLQYAPVELFSAIQVSIKTGNKLITYTSGTKDHKEGSLPITANDLFDIGSITKSYTAALAVLAESEGKLKLHESLSNYLSAYSNWGDLTLENLLNMSTGIPNYSNAPKINYLMSQNLQQKWTPETLIDLVYKKELSPPLRPGYFYSNTGYVLMDMILSNKYKTSYSHLLSDKIIKPLKLQHTFYPIPDYPADVLKHLVRGYSYNIYDNPELLGQDVTENNLSWAGAAGALVANSEDVIHWVEHLFIDDALLSHNQKAKMQTLVSTATGKAITVTTNNDREGFGLGIVQGYDAKIGHYWFYEGQTLGYRALYMYVPCNKVIISALFNSATNSENDHASVLIKSLYQQVIKQDNSLICKQNMAIMSSNVNSA